MKDKTLLKGLIGICNPFDLLHLKRYAEVFAFGLFQKEFGNHMIHVAEEHINELRPLEKEIGLLEEAIKKVKSLYDFDTIFTCKMHGFRTAQECYRKTSSVNILSDITIPTLFVNSMDDPVVR